MGGELHTTRTQYAIQRRSFFGVAYKLGCHLLATAIVSRYVTASAELNEICVAQRTYELLPPSLRPPNPSAGDTWAAIALRSSKGNSSLHHTE